MKLSDIVVTPLARIDTLGGDVLHGMRVEDVGYAGFGEVYFSWVEEGFVKAWKKHTRMTMNLVVPVGQVRFVFHAGDRQTFRVEEVGEDRHARITVPPGIWFGFQGLRDPRNLVVNIANMSHDPLEVERAAIPNLDFPWT